MRLSIIASKSNQGRVVIQEIFRQNFEDHRDVFDEGVVIEIADKFGLKDKYLAEKHSEWVEGIYQSNRSRAIRYQITETPSFIIEQQLKVRGELENIKKLIDDLLT